MYQLTHVVSNISGFSYYSKCQPHIANILIPLFQGKAKEGGFFTSTHPLLGPGPPGRWHASVSQGNS